MSSNYYYYFIFFYTIDIDGVCCVSYNVNTVCVALCGIIEYSLLCGESFRKLKLFSFIYL
jgi:hypothetical protein